MTRAMALSPPMVSLSFAKFTNSWKVALYPLTLIGIVLLLCLWPDDGKRLRDISEFGLETLDERRPVRARVLDMFYISQKGVPIAVQHPEIRK